MRIFARVAVLVVSPILLLAQSHELLDSALWMQTSAEHDAAYLQAYRQARFALHRALKNRNWTAAIEQTGKFKKLPPAIILDLDETILDNNRAQAQQVLDNQHAFDPAKWDSWVHQAEAGALPGAVEFTRYAASRGVKVFYVTNRNFGQEAVTMQNLAQLNFPLDEKVDTIYSNNEKPEWNGDKGTRRKAIAEHYRIVMMFGDDLGDFLSNVRVTPEERRKMVEKYSTYWGERWIVLPNPAYGSWDSALYGYDFKPSPEELLRRKAAWLRGTK